MSQIILENLDFSGLTPSSGEYILGVDISDGLPKLKRENDTLILAQNGDTFIYNLNQGNLYWEELSYTEFQSRLSSNILATGSFYIINDFKTKHIIQYTDTDGDGTGGDESTNLGSNEKLVIKAISNNDYDKNVLSLNYPLDKIIWNHNIQNREFDHSTSLGDSRGHILYRESKSGNSRDYDFRNFIFRRWRDLNGNYSIIRKIDAPDPSIFIDILSFDDNTSLNNKISSTNSSIYHSDNIVFMTYSTPLNNNLSGHGMTILSTTFSYNNFNIVEYSTISSSFSSVEYNNLYELSNTTILENFYNNNIDKIISSTLSNSYNNSGKILENSDITGFYSNNFNTLNGITSITFSNNDIIFGNSLSCPLISDNKINKIENNISSKIENNISITLINNNVDIISGNKIDNISGNISSNISNNYGTDLINNNINTLRGNKFSIIESNTFSECLDNSINKITGNISNKLNNNVGNIVSGNILTEISENDFNIISNNKDINLKGGLVKNNNVNKIDLNYDFSEISENISVYIIGNSFSNTDFFGSTAGFTFSGNPDVGDVITIVIGQNSYNITSTTQSINQFLLDISNTSPISLFSPTWSSDTFILTAPTTNVNMSGFTFSVSITGSGVSIENLNFNPLEPTLNDLTIDVSSFTNSEVTQYTIVIDGTGSNDTFYWIDSYGNSTSGLTISGSTQSLSYGVDIKFDITGHNTSDSWTFDVIPNLSSMIVNGLGNFSVGLSQSLSKIKSNNINNISNNFDVELIDNDGNLVKNSRKLKVLDNSGLKLDSTIGIPGVSIENSVDLRLVNKNLNSSIIDWVLSANLFFVDSITSSQTLTLTDFDTDYFGVNHIDSITLSIPSGVKLGKVISIKDESGDAFTNNIVLLTTLPELIDGTQSYTLNVDYGSVKIVKNGTNWWII